VKFDISRSQHKYSYLCLTTACCVSKWKQKQNKTKHHPSKKNKKQTKKQKTNKQTNKTHTCCQML